MKKQYLFYIGFIISFLLVCCKQKPNAVSIESMPEELAAIYKELQANPKKAEPYMKLSSYYIKTGQIDSALNNALVAVRMDSTNSNAYIALSDAYFASLHIDASEEALKKAISLNSKNNEAYLKLGELFFLLKDYTQSREILAKAIKQETFNPKAYFIMGWNFREEGDTLLAIRNYLIAADQNPDYFDAYMELGVLYHRAHDPLTVSYYNNALNVQPNNTQVLYNLAMFYQEIQDYEKSLEKYRMILQIDPNHKFALHNMGWIYLTGEEKYEEAVVFFTKAIEIDPEYVEAILNRGLSSEQLGQYSNARQDYMYALKLVNNYPLAIEGLNRLDNKMRK
jgi:tetratricopeptide (TPR) repeat protein